MLLLSRLLKGFLRCGVALSFGVYNCKRFAFSNLGFDKGSEICGLPFTGRTLNMFVRFGPCFLPWHGSAPHSAPGPGVWGVKLSL